MYQSMMNMLDIITPPVPVNALNNLHTEHESILYMLNTWFTSLCCTIYMLHTRLNSSCFSHDVYAEPLMYQSILVILYNMHS